MLFRTLMMSVPGVVMCRKASRASTEAFGFSVPFPGEGQIET